MSVVRAFLRATLLPGLALQLTACASSGPKPSYYGSGATTVSATVQAINYATRTVTLKDEVGEVSSFVVDPRVKNLDRVKVGDHVQAAYFESISVNVRDPKAPGGTGGVTAADISDWEDKGAFGRHTKVVAVVERVDRTNGTVALRGPSGNVHQFRVRDPNNLQNVDVGDEVVATYREALAVAIDLVGR